MDTMARRLAHALRERGMKPPDLIKASGLSKGTIYFILDGTTKADKVRAETVETICRILRIRREWLLRGKGEMDAGAIEQPALLPGTQSDELRLALAILAQAVAESIPTAGRAVVDALARLPDGLAERPYLKALAGTIRAEMAQQELLRAPKRRAKG